MRTLAYLPKLAMAALLVAVAAFVAAHPPVSAADDHGDSRLSATQVFAGSAAVNGYIGVNNVRIDLDFFSFNAQRGANYSVAVDAVSVERVGVSVSNSDGGSPGLVTYSNSGNMTTIDWVASNSDTYFVEVAGAINPADASLLFGDYTLKVFEDAANIDRHGDSASLATPIVADDTYRGSISPWYDRPGSGFYDAAAIDVDFFSFDATRGGQYTLAVGLDTSDGVAIEVADSHGNVQKSAEGVTSLAWTAADTSVHYISVTGTSRVRNSLGSYSLTLLSDLSLQDHHSQAWDTATPVIFGNAHRGAISPPSDADFFTFDARRGVVYTLSADLGTAEEVEIAVIDRGLTTLETNNGAGTTLEWSSPFNGKFIAAVSASNQVPNVTGSYSLTVAADTTLQDRYADSANEGTAISFGTLYQGAISPADDRDFFSFAGERGVQYTFALTYGTADAVSLSVKSRDGSPASAGRNFGKAELLQWTPDSDATIYVEVTSSPRAQRQTGTYSLQFSRDRALQDRHGDKMAEATPLGIGNAIKGAISPPSDHDYFLFQAQKGVTYTVETRLDSIDALRLTIENPPAGFSTSNYDRETSFDWTAPVSGSYLLSVAGADETADATGAYQISVAPKGETAPAPIPEPAAGTVIGPSDTALTIGARTAVPGGTVMVPLTLSNAGDITSLSFHLNYDPEVLRVTNVWRGPRLPENSWNHSADLPGVLRSLYAVTEPLPGAHPLAVVEFEVTTTEDTVTQLTFSDLLSGQVSSAPVEVKLLGGNVSIGQRLLGDGNGDGEIHALDAFIALKEAAKTGQQDLSLDVNGDGQVTVDDVYLILSLARPM